MCNNVATPFSLGKGGKRLGRSKTTCRAVLIFDHATAIRLAGAGATACLPVGAPHDIARLCAEFCRPASGHGSCWACWKGGYLTAFSDFLGLQIYVQRLLAGDIRTITVRGVYHRREACDSLLPGLFLLLSPSNPGCDR